MAKQAKNRKSWDDDSVKELITIVGNLEAWNKEFGKVLTKWEDVKKHLMNSANPRTVRLVSIISARSIQQKFSRLLAEYKGKSAIDKEGANLSANL